MWDCLIHNALVLTMEPGAGPLPQGYVAVPGGKIAAVGQTAADQDLPRPGRAWTAQGALVLPGLVNTHCHAPMVWFRGLADDLPLHTWLTEFIFPAEGAWLDADKVYWGALWPRREMIRGGITTVADGYFFEAECAGPWPKPASGPWWPRGWWTSRPPGSRTRPGTWRWPPSFWTRGAAYSGRLTSAVFCHSPYTCGAETLRRAKDLTRARQVPFVHPPGGNPGGSRRACQRRTGLTPVRLSGPSGGPG